MTCYPCVILAGGRGTRLGALTRTLPKTLIPVEGRPFADYQMSWLRRQGVAEVMYCIGRFGDKIRDYVGAGERWGIAVGYVDEGEQLRGTAGALRLAAEEGRLPARFAVLYGDSFLPFDLRALCRAAASSPQPATMAVHRNDGRWDRSNVIFESGRVLLYDKHAEPPEQARMRHIDYGISVLDRGLIEELVPAGASVDLAEVYRRLSHDGRLAGFEVAERFYEIGSPQGLADFRAWLRAGGSCGE